jgi:plastocyanin
MKSSVFAAGLLFAFAEAVSAAGTQSIQIEKFTFAPREIDIAAGTSVAWTNRDETPHAISAADRSFVSSGMDTGDRYEHTFRVPGDYPYFCTLHPFMTGIIHVHDKAGTGAPAPR